MTQVVCDRCGRSFEPPQQENIMIMINEDGNMRVKDLCDVCRGSLDEWWSKKKKPS